MKTIQITAPEGYEIDKEKSTFETIVFKEKIKDYKDIKTYEDALRCLGMSFIYFSVNNTPDEIAYKKLKVIIKVINQGWIPNWNDSNEKKWWPYFNLSSGFGFSDAYCGCDFTDTGVGSRLCFESEEKAQYAGKQFIEIYKDFLT